MGMGMARPWISWTRGFMLRGFMLRGVLLPMVRMLRIVATGCSACLSGRGTGGWEKLGV
jgi:hypothetical protein